MKISRSIVLISLTGIAYLIVLQVAIFGNDNTYYYRTIAYGVSFVLLLTFILLINLRIRQRDLLKTKQTPSQNIPPPPP